MSKRVDDFTITRWCFVSCQFIIKLCTGETITESHVFSSRMMLINTENDLFSLLAPPSG